MKVSCTVPLNLHFFQRKAWVYLGELPKFFYYYMIPSL